MALQAQVLEIRGKEEKQSMESVEDPNSFFSGLESFPTTMIQNFFLVWTLDFLPYERRYAKTNFITVFITCVTALQFMLISILSMVPMLKKFPSIL